jgi:hypothetical protein
MTAGSAESRLQHAPGARQGSTLICRLQGLFLIRPLPAEVTFLIHQAVDFVEPANGQFRPRLVVFHHVEDPFGTASCPPSLRPLTVCAHS